MSFQEHIYDHTVNPVPVDGKVPFDNQVNLLCKTDVGT